MPPPPCTSAWRRWPLVAALTLALLSALPAAAHAQADSLVPESVAPPSQTEPPPGFGISARQARSIAAQEPAVQRAHAEHPELTATVSIPTFGGEPGTFEVLFYTPGEESQYGSDIRVEVVVSGLTGEVVKVWTGPQAAAPLARGEEPSVGRSLNAPYVWLPLALIFLGAFFDPRRPLRLLHLDLVVLLGFGLSQLYFNQGRIDVSMPLVYPLLGYLAVRMLLAGFRPRERSEPLVPRLPVRWMAIGLVLLVAFRVGLNLADSNVIDVGYASVVGADRIVHGDELYVANDVHGDTYGPVNYLAYVPFELLFPWDGTWDSVPAAHAAAISFDLLTIVGLMLLGTTLRPAAAGGSSGSLWRSPGRRIRSRCSRFRRTRTTSWWRRSSCWRWLRYARRRAAACCLGWPERRSSRRSRSHPCWRAGPVRRGRDPCSHSASPARRSAWP